MLDKLLNTQELLLIMFTTKECKYCNQFKEEAEESQFYFDLKTKNILFKDIILPAKKDDIVCTGDVCELPLPNSGLRAKYNITALPTFILFVKGKESFRSNYLTPQDLISSINPYIIDDSEF